MAWSIKMEAYHHFDYPPKGVKAMDESYQVWSVDLVKMPESEPLRVATCDDPRIIGELVRVLTSNVRHAPCQIIITRLAEGR
jgi:hypothetical protein